MKNSDKIISLLNEAFSLEKRAFYFYFYVKVWCDGRDYDKASKFFYNQYNEELDHANKLSSYFNYLNLSPEFKGIPDININFNNLSEILEKSLEAEMDVTKHYLKLTEVALEEKDFRTFNFVQFFVEEQREEEETFKSLIQRANNYPIDEREYRINNLLEKFST